MRIVSSSTQKLASRYASKRVAALSSINDTTTQRTYFNSTNTTNTKLSSARKAKNMHITNKSMPFSSLGEKLHLHDLQDRGYFDNRNLLMFDTIHELQERSCFAFADNPLFGTYSKDVGDGKEGFEWMSYKEFGEKVKLCRSVLKDLGKLSMLMCQPTLRTTFKMEY